MCRLMTYKRTWKSRINEKCLNFEIEELFGDDEKIERTEGFLGVKEKRKDLEVEYVGFSSQF